MRPFFNRIINALGLLAFTSMISTGSILKWILPPGSGRLEMTLGRHREIFTYMGLMRHEWGVIHFYIAIAFLVILGIHLVLHWNWIKTTAWGTAKSPQPPLIRLTTAGIVIFLILGLVFPWLGQKESTSKQELIEMRDLAK